MSEGLRHDVSHMVDTSQPSSAALSSVEHVDLTPRPLVREITLIGYLAIDN